VKSSKNYSKQEASSQTAQDYLIKHLRNIGYIQDDNFERAFKDTHIEKITPEEYVSLFCLDRPTLFYFVKDAEKPIAAPQMICAMVQELNLKENSNVLILGSGGGFIPTIVSKIATKGKVTVIEQNEDIFNVTKDNLKRLKSPSNINLDLGDPLVNKKSDIHYDRILVMGCIPDIPKEMMQWLTTGGVVIAPVGGGENQIMIRASKREKNDFHEDNMGNVRFVELESNKAKTIKPRKIEIEYRNEFSDSFKESTFIWSFPFPIAYVVRSFQNYPDPHSKFTRLLDIHDVTTRFLATIVMCDLIANAHNDEVQEILHKSHLNLQKPTLGTWVGTLNGLCKKLYDEIENPFIPDLHKSILSSDKLLNQFVEVRNKYHGHGSTQSSDDYQELVNMYWPTMMKILSNFSLDRCIGVPHPVSIFILNV